MSTIEQTQTLPAGTWTLDKVHSAAGFAVKHMVVATYRSQIETVDATIEDGVLTGIVQADSIVAKDENLKGHLLSPEFFDTENTPEIRFVSTAVRPAGEGVIVEGDLTIKGHTERVEARGTISEPYEDFTNTEKLGIDLETVVDRTKFGLNWNAPLPKGGFAVANDVTISVHLEFAPAARVVMRILGIAGSLRQDSFNAALLRAAGVERPEGTEFVEWNGMRAVPPYDEDAEGRVPAAVAELKAAIAGADAVVVATPEYNASIPGVLKNTIDWVSRPFAANPLRGKPVLVIGASTGMFGAVWAQAETRKILAHLGAEVIDEELPVILAEDRFESGVLVDDDVREVLRERMTQLSGLVTEPQLLNAA